MNFKKLYDKKMVEHMKDTELYKFLQLLINVGGPGKSSTVLIDEIYENLKKTELIHNTTFFSAGLVQPNSRNLSIGKDPIMFKEDVECDFKYFESIRDIIVVGYKEYSAERRIDGKRESRLAITHKNDTNVDSLFESVVNDYSVDYPIIIFIISGFDPKSCIVSAFQDY